MDVCLYIIYFKVLKLMRALKQSLPYGCRSRPALCVVQSTTRFRRAQPTRWDCEAASSVGAQPSTVVRKRTGEARKWRRSILSG